MELKPKKSLGQHFLNSRHVLDQIIEAAAIKPGENILEIGPGTGVLTEALFHAGAKVIAVEKDARACEILKDKFRNELADGRLSLIQGDVLAPSDHHFPHPPIAPYAIVSNIPYYATGAILEKFLAHEPRPNRMILLVQREVADRIAAKNGKESILSISVKAFGVPRIAARVPRGAFTPAPKVDSAVLVIENISNSRFIQKKGEQNQRKRKNKKDNGISTERFFAIVHAGFAHKRKFVVRNLETVLDAQIIARKWQKSGLDPKTRAEDITLEQWLELARP